MITRTEIKKSIGGLLIAMLLLAPLQGFSQAPAPPGADLAAFAARRFPQPVRLGDLIHRMVLLPLESRPILGHVILVAQSKDGTMKIVMTYGGFLGFGARRIAVPADAMVLLGSELEVLDFTPQQLSAFPVYQDGEGAPIGDSEFIRMGLAHPSH